MDGLSALHVLQDVCCTLLSQTSVYMEAAGTWVIRQILQICC